MGIFPLEGGGLPIWVPFPTFLNLFLAAKRSSTSALLSPSVCLSVRPSVLKRNISLFGQLMTTYDTL